MIFISGNKYGLVIFAADKYNHIALLPWSQVVSFSGIRATKMYYFQKTNNGIFIYINI